MSKELTNEQEAMSQLYSVLCAVVSSDRTPKHTAEAVIATLQKLFEDENGPFTASDNMIGMTIAMAEAMNGIVKQRNKHIQRVAEANSILGDINWN
jgi:uncharacterized protein (UPF0147 family)